jgi:hypothetical protein
MVSLALRNLSRERTRLAISVDGIAFAVTLIVLVRASSSPVRAEWPSTSTA